MDSKMVDNEEQREDRKSFDEHVLPNRMERRRIAKQRGVFKRKGLWGYINNRGDKNESTRKPNEKESNGQ